MINNNSKKHTRIKLTAMLMALVLVFCFAVIPQSETYAAINPYVIFDTQGGSAIATLNPVKGTEIYAPTPPTKSGYAFAGWYTQSVGGSEIIFPYTVTETVTFYARWNAFYTITWDANGGKFADYDYTVTFFSPDFSETTTYMLNHGDPFPHPEIPEIDGATFTFWVYVENDSSSYYISTAQTTYSYEEDIIVYLDYDIPPCVVYVDLMDGNGPFPTLTSVWSLIWIPAFLDDLPGAKAYLSPVGGEPLEYISLLGLSEILLYLRFD